MKTGVHIVADAADANCGAASEGESRGKAMREPALETLFQALGQALRAASDPPDGARDAYECVLQRLETPGEKASLAPRPQTVVAEHLQPALARARAVSAPLADALSSVAPHLAWAPKPGTEDVPGDFHRRHVNALIAGPEGLERREDVRVGISLLAPETRYPDHHHPPEEVYIALSEGDWRQNDGPWRRPGPGGLVYNPPDILHAMRSGATPLFAVWLLPI